MNLFRSCILALWLLTTLARSANGLPSERADVFTWAGGALKIQLAEPENIRVELFDALGRNHFSLAEHRLTQGKHSWILPNSSNQPLWMRITTGRGTFLLRQGIIASLSTRVGTRPAGMRRIPAGQWRIGSLESEPGRYGDETLHQVKLSSFWMDTVEITRSEFSHLLGFEPSQCSCRGNCPVDNVTWFDAIAFCNARSRSQARDTVYRYVHASRDASGHFIDLEQVSANPDADGFRLPTEAQWEVAARAGAGTPWGWGIDSTPATSFSWFAWNSSSTSHAVGTLAANAWGFHDLQGNVWEWTWDWYNGYDTLDSLDPSGSSTGDMRCYRGGGWESPANHLRSALRNGAAPTYRDPSLGFRCVRRATE